MIILGVIALVAFPAFTDSMRKGRRAEAFAALNAVQLAQERWRANNATYTDQLTNGPSASPPGLGLKGETTSGFYTLGLSNHSGTGYTALASAVSGKSQANDRNCKVLGVRMNGGSIQYGSGDGSIDWSASTPTPALLGPMKAATPVLAQRVSR